MNRAERDELSRRLSEATQGEWGVWTEPTATREDAVRECTELVRDTEPFSGALEMVSAAMQRRAPTAEESTARSHFVAASAWRPRVSRSTEPTTTNRKELNHDSSRLHSIPASGRSLQGQM